MPRTASPIGTAGRFPGTAADAPVDPAWQQWLELLEIALDEARSEAGAVVVPPPAARPSDAPLLHRATVRLDVHRAHALVCHLADAAGVLGASELDPRQMIRAAIMRDDRAITGMAEHVGTSADTLAVLAQMAAVPVLHAAARGLSTLAARVWQRGYCPACGAWPSLVEMRGIERERRLRCGCCGADWPLPILRCAFCGETDHHRLGSLLPEGEGQYRRIETCEHCHGYLKAVMTLGALPLRILARHDLATVPLDLVAQDRGYARPSRPGWALALEVVA
ncbi:MAG TPA: formate dehydrogenase accessory protein FdhE [Gemmatimonadaceae bacterium]|nr:formate dehydrogenase accessory protein FdhE [Gemmatimonadaceae bacterium]